MTEYERYHSHADASEHFNHVGFSREKSDQILARWRIFKLLADDSITWISAT